VLIVPKFSLGNFLNSSERRKKFSFLLQSKSKGKELKWKRD
jgi:hypothetical protein